VIACAHHCRRRLYRIAGSRTPTFSRTFAEETVPNVPAKPPLTLNEIVLHFTLRLRDAVETATHERGEEIITTICSQLGAGATSRLAKRARKLADKKRRELVARLTQRFLHAIEESTAARVRDSLHRELAVREAAAGHSSLHAGQLAPAKTPTQRRGRRRPLPPPRDPEQIKRDAEFARLRALLRPAAEEPPPAPAPVVPVPAVPPQCPPTPGEFLRALEKEIQNAVPSLGALGPERCGAQIAVWAGQVRELRDGLPPEVSAVMRPAIRIFLEHLTELRAAMDAHFVDALENKWNAPDWGDYVEVNRACVEERPPALSADKLEIHHRAMLRALVLPHRRNVPAQAIPVINAAAEVLPADDSQLRSAIRRHSSEWQANADSETDSPPIPLTVEEPPVEISAEASTAESTSESTEPAPAGDAEPAPSEDPAPPPAEAVTPETEFEHPWTK
jgi:hypothetical protein